MSIIIADASPLIALATIGRLGLLQHLYQNVVIPAAVEKELKLDSNMRAEGLKQAIEDGWLKVSNSTFESESFLQLLQILDRGETEAIFLTELIEKTQSYQFLLIDERKGRKIAKKRGIKIAGSGAVLLAAKKKGFITSLKNELESMTINGYRLSNPLKQRLLELSGE